MKKLVQEIKSNMAAIEENLDKPTKAAEARARKLSLGLEKQFKQYRKDSIAQHKS